MGQPARVPVKRMPAHALTVVPSPAVAKAQERKTFLTPDQVVARWEGVISLQTVTNWRNKKVKKGPAYHKIGGKVLYDLEDIKFYERVGRVILAGEAP